MQPTTFKPEDTEKLERNKPSGITQTGLDIAELILHDTQNYEVENQSDDAENYLRYGNEYFERMYVILACCLLLADDDGLHLAVKKFFVDQAGDSNKEHNPDFPPAQNEPYIQRMISCIRANREVKKVCEYLFTWYIKTHVPVSTENSYDRMVRIVRMKISRGMRICNDYCPLKHGDIDVLACEAESKKIKPVEPEEEDDCEERKRFTDEEMGIGTGLHALTPEELLKLSEEGFEKSTESLVKRVDQIDIMEGVEEKDRPIWRKILGL